MVRRAACKTGRQAGKRRGRVLRVKTGYNPNSSSIGSIVFALSAKVLPATAAFGAVAGLIYAAFLRPDRRTHEPDGKDEEEPLTTPPSAQASERERAP